MRGWMNTLLILGWMVYVTVADQIVYLERPSGGPTWEPFFNPKTVTASVGEKISFIARFNPIVHDSTSEVFPLEILPYSLYPRLSSLSVKLWVLIVVICTLELGFRRIQLHSSLRI